MTDKELIINKISNQKSDYKHPSQAEDLANSLDTISDDIYSESERFIYELIQNADDASNDQDKELEIKIEFTQNFVVISHNGREFNTKDINAISSIGKSQKSETPNQTGYKGIGFKSVFGKSDCVYINSNGFCFRYDKTNWQSYSHKLPWQIIPIWSNNKVPLELQETKFGKYPVSTAIQFNEKKGFSGVELKETLKSLFSNSQIMLFLRNVSHLSIGKEFFIHKRRILISEKSLSKTESFLLSTVSLASNNEQTNWIIGDFIGIELDSETKITLRQDEKAPKRLRETQFTNISFAGKINNKGYLERIKEDSLIFTYLPTKINKNFPYLVNADFLTNAPREGFHEDRFWNAWLFKQVGRKSIEWLRELASTDYRYQISNVIANTFNSEKVMEKAFNEGYKEAITTIAFIPNINNRLLLVEDSLIEETDIDEVINKITLVEYYNRKNKTQFTVENLVNKKLKSTFLSSRLAVKTFKVEDLKNFFSSDELCSSLKVEENFEIIKFFHKKATNKTSADLWKDYIYEIPFIANEQGLLRTPKEIYFPINDFEKKISQNFDFVHFDVLKNINSNLEIREWLYEIGVVEPTPKNIIENTITYNFDKLTSTSEKSIETVRYLFENRKYISDFSRFTNIKLVTTKGDLKRANSCYLADHYKPELAIESHLPHEDFFVSIRYIKKNENIKEWNLFFTQIGVNEDFKRVEYPKIHIHELIKTFNSPYLNFAMLWARNQIAGEGGFESRSEFENLKIITFIEHISNNHLLSKIFWNKIFSEKLIKLSDIIDNVFIYKYHTYKPISYFEWFLSEKNSFPTTNTKVLKPYQVIINRSDFKKIGGNSLPILDLDIELPKEIENDTRVFNFRKTIELEEYLKVLTDISEVRKLEGDEVSKTTERIELIYQALSKFTRTHEEETIKKWAKNNKLLSTNNKFIPCSDLYFLDVEHFKLPLEVKAFIKTSSTNISRKILINLLKLFGVKIIDKKSLSYEKENITTDYELKLSILNKLPLLALVVAAKENKNYPKTLQNLQSVVNAANFFKAEKLYLDCTIEKKMIFVVQKMALAENMSFYHIGSWYNPVTLYDLTTELCVLLSTKDISKELNVLLLTPFIEGLRWLENQQYDITEIPMPNIETDNNYKGDFRTEAQKRLSNEIGEKAERFVFTTLVERYKAKYHNEKIEVESLSIFKTKSVKLIWHRFSGNYYNNHDITIIEKEVEKYIEVKATKDSEQTDSTLFLSYNEWNLMKTSNDRYLLARVFNGHKPTQVIFVKMERVEP